MYTIPLHLQRGPEATAVGLNTAPTAGAVLTQHCLHLVTELRDLVLVVALPLAHTVREIYMYNVYIIYNVMHIRVYMYMCM